MTAQRCFVCLTIAGLLAVAACNSDDDSNKGGSAAGAGKSGPSGKSGASDKSGAPSDLNCATRLVDAPSPYCEQCVCEKCEDIALACEQSCWDLISCMHRNCGANEANLESCAADACKEHAAGLTQAKAFAGCIYKSSERGRPRAERTSCLIACNYGPLPKDP